MLNKLSVAVVVVLLFGGISSCSSSDNSSRPAACKAWDRDATEINAIQDNPSGDPSADEAAVEGLQKRESVDVAACAAAERRQP